MNRRDFIRTAAAYVALGAMPGVARGARKKSGQPNIIFFLTDDQDKVSIGAYGSDAYSPNLDRMAKEGMIFHQAFVSSTVCTPSRYSFLTGRYAGRSYSKTYLKNCPEGMQGFPSFNLTLEEDNMNVGNVLSKNGYATGYVGKYHVGEDMGRRKEEFDKRGLKYVDGNAAADKASSNAFRHNELWYREQLKQLGFSWVKNIYWGNLKSPFHSHNPEWTISAALEFIEKKQDRSVLFALLHNTCSRAGQVLAQFDETSGSFRAGTSGRTSRCHDGS